MKVPFKLEDVRQVAASQLRDKDAELQRRFGDLVGDRDDLPLVTEPTAYVDDDDLVVGWFLCGALEPQRSASRLHILRPNPLTSRIGTHIHIRTGTRAAPPVGAQVQLSGLKLAPRR